MNDDSLKRLIRVEMIMAQQTASYPVDQVISLVRRADLEIFKEWFLAYAGDVIPNEDYQRLLPMLDRLFLNEEKHSRT